MKKEEIIEQIRVYELEKIIKYESMSKKDLLGIIKKISGCEVPKMKGDAHVVVFNTVSEHNEWVSALSELGYDVETVEIMNRPPAKYRINRRNVYVGYKPEDLATGDNKLWHKNDSVTSQYADKIFTLAFKLTSEEYHERVYTLKKNVHELREVLNKIPNTGAVITDEKWNILYIFLDNQPVMIYYDCRYNNYAIGLML